VRSLAGLRADETLAAAGKAKFEMNCAACHNADGTGNQVLGAPNLTDNTWLYGSAKSVIKKTIDKGRSGQMPAHKDFLGEDKVHLLSAYIYSLSNQ
jgi:cytochrome c oxidase cbb3-type subunit 3